MEKNRVKLVVIFKLKSGCSARDFELLDGISVHMQHEPTFIDLVALQDQDNPDTVMLYETWADRDEFENVQMKRDYRDAYWKSMPDLVREPPTVIYMDVVRDVRPAAVG